MKARAALLLLLSILPPAGARAEWTDVLPKRASSEDFYSAFSRGLFERESGWAGDARQTCGPDDGVCGFQTTAAWLAGSQARLLSRAAEQALRARYALDEWSRGWLSRPWDARKTGAAVLIGAAELYTDGLRLRQQAAGFTVRGTIAPVRRLRGEGRTLASLELGRGDGPLSLSAAWGRTVPAFGLRYFLRY